MSRRLVAALLIPLVLIAASVYDGRRERPVRGSVPAPAKSATEAKSTVPEHVLSNAATFAPVVASAGAYDSAWFCAAGTANASGTADANVVIVNASDQAVNAAIRVVTDQGATGTVSVQVAAHERGTLRLADTVQGNWAAATVTTDGGQVAVSLVAAGNGSVSVTPCASRASASWYFAAGNTDRGATEFLALYNPYPDDASVNVTLETDAGVRNPQALHGLPVPAGSLVMVRLNDYENRRVVLGASIVAPVGRVVVARIQGFNGEGAAGSSGAPPKGTSVSLGVPHPSTSWTWPYGTKVANESDQYVLYNPAKQDAKVEVLIALTDPAQNGTLRPFPVTVPAGSVVTFDVATLTQVPASSTYAVTVRSTNDQPIVAERVAIANTPPATGVSMSPGTPLRATRWVVSALDTRGATAYVSIANPGMQPASVVVQRLGAPPEAPKVIAAGDRLDVSVTNVGQATPSYVVSSDNPIVVGSLQFSPTGISASVAEPELDSVSLP